MPFVYQKSLTPMFLVLVHRITFVKLQPAHRSSKGYFVPKNPGFRAYIEGFWYTIIPTYI